MKLPTRLRYGMRFLANISQYHNTNKTVSINKISKEEGISNKYLEQIITSFVRAGFIKGTRGKGGGYKIIKEPSKITVYDIALSLDEDFKYLNCVRKKKSCKRSKDCSIVGLWEKLSEQSINLFKKHKLSEYIKS